MRHECIVLLGVLVLPCFSFVPNFDVNLDDPPEKRWVHITKYYKPELIHLLKKMGKVMNASVGAAKENWTHIPFHPEHVAELQGMVTALNHPVATLQNLKFWNMQYEMMDKAGCSGVLWANPVDGTMIHGRNLDFLFKEKHKKMRNHYWQSITFIVHMYRGATKLYIHTVFPGIVGINTALLLSTGPGTGWAFQQNTRRPNKNTKNLEAALQGGKLFGTTARQIMESTPNFKVALKLFDDEKFMSPSYFVLSGSGPFEGAVLSVDRLGEHKWNSPPLQHVSNSSVGKHLVQTNDDMTHTPEDKRRPLAIYLLDHTEQIPSPENMLQFMHTSMLLNEDTVFTTVMVPSTGYFKVVLPEEPPGPLDGFDLQKRIDKGPQDDVSKGEITRMLWHPGLSKSDLKEVLKLRSKQRSNDVQLGGGQTVGSGSFEGAPAGGGQMAGQTGIGQMGLAQVNAAQMSSGTQIGSAQVLGNNQLINGQVASSQIGSTQANGGHMAQPARLTLLHRASSAIQNRTESFAGASHQRRFLAPHSKRQNKAMVPFGDAGHHPVPADDISFMQLSWKLET